VRPHFVAVNVHRRGDLRDVQAIDHLPFHSALQPANDGYQVPEEFCQRPQQEVLHAATRLDEWDQDKSFWTLSVVSSSLKPNVERERSQPNLQHGCLGEWQNCRLWAFTWGEIIDRAKEELNGVREHLAHKSKELKIAEHLRENFPHLGIRTEDQSDRADATDGSGRRQQKTSAP
jgi:hypothetical protein